MFDLGYLEPRGMFVMPGYAEILHDLVGLLYKRLVDVQCACCVRTRHFEIMLWPTLALTLPDEE